MEKHLQSSPVVILLNTMRLRFVGQWLVAEQKWTEKCPQSPFTQLRRYNIYDDIRPTTSMNESSSSFLIFISIFNSVQLTQKFKPISVPATNPTHTTLIAHQHTTTLLKHIHASNDRIPDIEKSKPRSSSSVAQSYEPGPLYAQILNS